MIFEWCRHLRENLRWFENFPYLYAIFRVYVHTYGTYVHTFIFLYYNYYLNYYLNKSIINMSLDVENMEILPDNTWTTIFELQRTQNAWFWFSKILELKQKKLIVLVRQNLENVASGIGTTVACSNVHHSKRYQNIHSPCISKP